MRLDHLLSTEIQGAGFRVRCRPRPDGPASVGLLVWKRSVALVWYGHAFGFPDRHRAFGSGVGPPYRVPSVPLVGFAGSGSGRGGGLRTGEWTRARKILFLFTVFSDELLLVEVLFFVLIVL